MYARNEKREKFKKYGKINKFFPEIICRYGKIYYLCKCRKDTRTETKTTHGNGNKNGNGNIAL